LSDFKLMVRVQRIKLLMFVGGLMFELLAAPLLDIILKFGARLLFKA